MKNGILEINRWGDKIWWLNGKYHRVDGPAVIWNDGSKFWYLKGLRHRLDGPARIWPNGDKRWWVNDIEYTEDEFNNMILTRWKILFKN